MFGTDESPETTLRKKFWSELDDSPFIMLGLKGVEDDRTRPMTAQIDVPEDGDKDEGGQIYFFASKTDGVGQAIEGPSRAVATFAAKGHGLFAHVHGTLMPSDDKAVLERLWNPIIASWSKDGKDYPALQLLRFDTASADVWEAAPGATLKAAALKTLFNVDPVNEHGKEHRPRFSLMPITAVGLTAASSQGISFPSLTRERALNFTDEKYAGQALSLLRMSRLCCSFSMARPKLFDFPHVDLPSAIMGIPTGSIGALDWLAIPGPDRPVHPTRRVHPGG